MRSSRVAPACEAIGDHHLCPGITSLHAGDFELGTVACDCPCHKKPESDVPRSSLRSGPFRDPRKTFQFQIDWAKIPHPVSLKGRPISSSQLRTWFSSSERQRIRVASLYVYRRLYQQGGSEPIAGVQSRRQWQKECRVCSSP
jgi:hypothetical protein